MSTEAETNLTESIKAIVSNLDSSSCIAPEDLARLKELNGRDFDDALEKCLRFLDQLNLFKVLMANVYIQPTTGHYDFNIINEMKVRLREIGITFNTNSVSETKINTVSDNDEGKPEIIIDLSSNSDGIEVLGLLIKALVLYYSAKESADNKDFRGRNLVDNIEYRSLARAMLLVTPMLNLILFEKDSAVLFEPVKSLAASENPRKQLYEVNSMDIRLPSKMVFET